MLPELILKEEEEQRPYLLLALGIFSGLAGFGLAKFLFPSQVDLLAVVFASMPLVFPVMYFLLENEEGVRPHIDELTDYGALFTGEAFAFFFLGTVFPEAFRVQSEVVGLSGAATSPGSLWMILSNNLLVFSGIVVSSAVIGSAGAFILTWNASVLGFFLSTVFKDSPLNALAYLPHATLEMAGFVVAGISGTMMSAAVYRKHFDRETWIDFLKLTFTGVLLILGAGVLETA